MTPALAAVVFLPGLAIGSFLNVVAARMPLGRSIVRPGVGVPVAATCRSAVRQHPGRLVAAAARPLPQLPRRRSRGATPLSSSRRPRSIVGCFLDFGLTSEAVVASFFCAVLVAISAIDIERRIIPNRIVLPAAAVVLVAQTALEPSPEWAIAGLGAATFLFLAALAYPGGMGMGDVKLALLLGFMLGRTVPIAIFVAMIAALVPSVVLLARHGRAARKMRIPFGPFLALGGVVALFAGDVILDAYLGSM